MRIAAPNAGADAAPKAEAADVPKAGVELEPNRLPEEVPAPGTQQHAPSNTAVV